MTLLCQIEQDGLTGEVEVEVPDKWFEDWLIDNPQYHPDDDRSDAIQAFAESDYHDDISEAVRDHLRNGDGGYFAMMGCHVTEIEEVAR